MRTSLIILFAILSTAVFAQKATISTSVAPSDEHKDFKNQGEQEASWAAKLFDKNYIKEKYDSYTEKIVVKGNSFTFNDKVLELVEGSPEMKAFLGRGILYPELFDVEFGINKMDTLKISGLEEMKSLSKQPTSKRFKFSTSKKGLLNPTVYLIEVTNEQATSKTNIKDFIAGCSLTFFMEGWVQI